MLLQGLGHGFHHEHHRRQLDVRAGIVGHARLADPLQLGDVGVVEIGEMRDGERRADHVGRDGLADFRHRLAADRAPSVALARRGRRRAGRRAGGVADRGDHILARDPPLGASAVHVREIDSQLARKRRTAGPAGAASALADASSSCGSTAGVATGSVLSAPSGHCRSGQREPRFAAARLWRRVSLWEPTWPRALALPTEALRASALRAWPAPVCRRILRRWLIWSQAAHPTCRWRHSASLLRASAIPGRPSRSRPAWRESL